MWCSIVGGWGFQILQDVWLERRSEFFGGGRWMVRLRRNKEKKIKLVLEVLVQNDIEAMEVAVAIGGLLRDLDNRFKYGVFYGIEGVHGYKSNRVKQEWWDEEEEEEEKEGKIPPDNHFNGIEVM
jgi:hypothetical protein